MKSNKLIELIMEADPTGEGEFVVGEDGNADIFCIESKPGYWDGCYHVMVRDYSKQCYNVIGAQYRSDGVKHVIRSMTTCDALYDDKDLPVEVFDTFVKKKMADQVAAWRTEARECEETIMAPIFMKLMGKLKEGHRILQDKKDRGNKFFTLHWDEIAYNKHGGPKNSLYSGECKLVFKSGFFYSVEDNKHIQWKLSI